MYVIPSSSRLGLIAPFTTTIFRNESGMPSRDRVIELFVADLFPLNQECVEVAALGSSEHALASTLSVVALAIPPANVKATSRAPFARP